ncbi:hypothetical protein ACFOMH_20480, partial [Paracoccus mangrovi]
KRAPRSRQRHDLYAKYHDYDSEISDLLGECGLLRILADDGRAASSRLCRTCARGPNHFQMKTITK